MITIKYFYEIQNEKHQKIVAEANKLGLSGSEALEFWNKSMSGWYEETILKAKEAYYTGNPTMDDETFDKFEQYLRAIKPESDVLKKVGYDI